MNTLGVIKPNKIWVSSRTEKTLSVWKNNGINTTFNNYEVVQNCDIIFLAIKPQMLDEALKTSKPPGYTVGKLFVSVMVGIPLDVLDAVSHFYFKFSLDYYDILQYTYYTYYTFQKLQAIAAAPKIIRSMPNTPMMLAEGITG